MFCTNCRSDPEREYRRALSARQVLLWPGAEEARRLISQDREEGFFARIRSFDLALQMGLADTLPGRDSLLSRYRAELQNEVRPFSRAEQKLTGALLQRAFDRVENRYPGLWPDTLQLIKISGQLYGPGTWYTRGRAIVIPEDQLVESDTALLLRIFLHELFHVYSRQHRGTRDSLYGLVGFRRPGRPVVLPSELAERRLLNPDGVEEDFLLWPPQGPPALPLIYGHELGQPFRAAFRWRYYGLVERPEGFRLQPERTLEGNDPVVREMTGGNTAYLIHPDEILADNFVLLFSGEAAGKAGRSAAGQRVLDRLDAYLSRQHETTR